jgi:hypothetical protein
VRSLCKNILSSFADPYLENLRWSQMEAIDVDEIIDVEFPEPTEKNEGPSVEIEFKDGRKKTFSGPDLPEVLAILSHWTPPTA